MAACFQVPAALAGLRWGRAYAWPCRPSLLLSFRGCRGRACFTLGAAIHLLFRSHRRIAVLAVTFARAAAAARAPRLHKDPLLQAYGGARTQRSFNSATDSR